MARSLPLWRRSPSRGAHGAAACGAALALLAPACWCHRDVGGVTLGRRFSASAARALGTVRSARRLALSECRRQRSRFLSGGVAVTRRSRRHCLRRRASAPGTGSVVPPRSWANYARPPLFCGGGLPFRRGVWCPAARALFVLSSTRSIPLWVRSPWCGAPGAPACSATLALLAPARSCSCTRGCVTFGRRSTKAATRSLGVVRSARRLALAACGRWRNHLRGGRCRAAHAASLPAAPRRRSWRRLGRAAALAAAWRSAAALPQQRFSLSLRCVVLGDSRSLRVVDGRSLPLWRRSPSRSAHSAAACGAALALLAPAWWCRRDVGGVTLGRRFSTAAARSLGTVRSARRLPLSACRRQRSHFLNRGGRRHAALTAPLPAAPR